MGIHFRSDTKLKAKNEFLVAEQIRSSCIRGLLNLLCHWKEAIASSVAFVLLNMLDEVDIEHIVSSRPKSNFAAVPC